MRRHSALPVWFRLLLGFAAGGLAARAATTDGVLTDLPEPDLAALEESERERPLPSDATNLLDRVLESAGAYAFDGALARVVTDRRWFLVDPPNSPGAPFLELRRWPGDSALALYALRGPMTAATRVPRTVEGASLRPKEGSSSTWEGTLATPAGTRPILWIERAVEGAASHLGIVLLPGDGGLGRASLGFRTTELLAIAARLQIEPEAWRGEAGIEPSTPLDLPALDSAVGDGDEKKHPWQVVVGADYTLGLPPGVRAFRTDRGVSPPRAVAGGSLWLRGRFRDRTGANVVVGDARRAGYLADVGTPSAEWAAGSKAPRGVASGSLAAASDFDEAREWTKALTARAERWTEPGYEGAWLIFRLAFKDRGVEIGLPVLEGRQSTALFWLPLTWRGAGELPAAAPIDAAERFGIRFERFTRIEQAKNPWIEGFLSVPGLRAELPRSWEAAANLRTEDGFPVTVVDREGRILGRLSRVEAQTRPPGPDWSPHKNPRVFRASAVFVKPDGSRFYIAGEGPAFLLEPLPGAAIDRELWDRLADSVTLVAPKPEGRRD